MNRCWCGAVPALCRRSRRNAGAHRCGRCLGLLFGQSTDPNPSTFWPGQPDHSRGECLVESNFASVGDPLTWIGARNAARELLFRQSYIPFFFLPPAIAWVIILFSQRQRRSRSLPLECRVELTTGSHATHAASVARIAGSRFWVGKWTHLWILRGRFQLFSAC